MAQMKLEAARRADTGKGPARRSRMAGKVPAVVYGLGMEPVAIEVDRRELITALNTEAGFNMLLDIQIDGSSTLALTRELQRDPVKGTLVHADFVKVDVTQAVEVEVPIHLVGDAPGVREGGVLEQPLHAAHLRCLPTQVPEVIEADVTALGIGDSLRVADLTAPEGAEILNDPELPVVTVATPISEADLVAAEAEAALTGAEGVPEEGAAQTPTDAAAERGETAPDTAPEQGS